MEYNVEFKGVRGRDFLLHPQRGGGNSLEKVDHCAALSRQVVVEIVLISGCIFSAPRPAKVSVLTSIIKLGLKTLLECVRWADPYFLYLSS